MVSAITKVNTEQPLNNSSIRLPGQSVSVHNVNNSPHLLDNEPRKKSSSSSTKIGTGLVEQHIKSDNYGSMADTKHKTGNNDPKSGKRTSRTSATEKSVSAISKGESSEHKTKSGRSDSDRIRIKKLSEDGISERNEVKKKERDPAREQRKSRDRDRDSDNVTTGSYVDKERKSRSRESDVNRESRKVSERDPELLNSSERSKKTKQREFSKARDEEPRRNSDVVSKSRSRATDNAQIDTKTTIKNDSLQSFISKEKPKKTSRASKSVMSSESKHVSRGKSLVDPAPANRELLRTSNGSLSLNSCQSAFDDSDIVIKSGSDTETEDEHLKKLKERQGMNRQKHSTTSRSRSSSRGRSSESRSRSSDHRLPTNIAKHPDHRSSGHKIKNESSSPRGSISSHASAKKEVIENDNSHQLLITNRADSDLSSVQLEEAVVQTQPDDDDDHLKRIKERQNLIRQKHGASTTGNRSRSLSRTRGVSRTRSSDGMDKTLIKNSVADKTTNKSDESSRSASRARGVSRTRSRDGNDMARVRNSITNSTTSSVDDHSQQTTDETENDGEDEHLKRIKERQSLIRQRPTAQARSRSLSRTRGIARTGSSDGLQGLNSDSNHSTNRGRSRSRNHGGSLDSTSDHETNSRSGNKSSHRSGRSSSRQGRGTKGKVDDGPESETSEADDIDSDDESEKQTTNFLSFLKFTNPNLAKHVTPSVATKTESEPVRSLSMTTAGLSRLIGGMGFRKSSGDSSVCPDDASVVSKQEKRQKKKTETDNHTETRSDRSAPKKPNRSENILGTELMMGNSSWDEENEFDFGFNPKPPSHKNAMIDAVGVFEDNAKKRSSTAQSRAYSMDGGPGLNLPVTARQRGLSRHKSIDPSSADDFLDFRRSFK